MAAFSLTGSVTISAMFGVGSLEGNSLEVDKAVKVCNGYATHSLSGRLVLDGDLLLRLMQLVDDLVSNIGLDASVINLFPLLDDLCPAWFPTPWRRKAARHIERDRQGWKDLLDLALDGKGARMSTCAQF